MNPAEKCHAEALLALDEVSRGTAGRPELLALAQIKMTEAVYWRLTELTQKTTQGDR